MDLTHGERGEDVLLPEATGQDIVELRPGQWIGAEESFFLFSPTLTGGLGPDCIRVRLVLFLTPMRPGGCDIGDLGPPATTP